MGGDRVVVWDSCKQRVREFTASSIGTQRHGSACAELDEGSDMMACSRVSLKFSLLISFVHSVADLPPS